MKALDSPTMRHSELIRFLGQPLVFGTLCGLVSALGYTAANACLTAVSDHDAVWISCVKAFPTVALFGPVVLWRLFRRSEVLPSWRHTVAVILASLVCQLLGNVVFQWALGVVGMALTVPLTLGTIIIGGAVMGRLFLHESVTLSMAISLTILIAAIFVLSLGADEASRAVAHQHVEPGSWRVAAGVGAACLSGVAYALLGVVIRHVVTDKISIAMTMVTVTSTGLVSLGALSLFSPGLAAMRATPLADFSVMLLAGLFNAGAFLALTKSLQFLPVVYVNALNATQATMAAIAGILLFAEPSSGSLWLGVSMTVLGLVTMRRRFRSSDGRISVQTDAPEIDLQRPNERRTARGVQKV